MTVTPWWDALSIRPEIITSSGEIDDVQMSLFRAVYETGDRRPRYANPGYYGEITYPTDQLVDLLAKVAVRLGGGDGGTAAPALKRLDQGMGGGKSHACIGCWHLAAHPADLADTDLGKRVFATAEAILGKALPQDLNSPHVVVLPCDNMTPGAADKALDGPAVSLYERFLWRLFDHDYPLYERYQSYFSDKSKIAEALRTVGRPILIIIDEVLDYIRALSGLQRPELSAQDMAFLRALLDTVNDVPNVAMIVVMIASEKDTMDLDEAARGSRDELHALLERNGQPATVNENADFSAILRRRLFVEPPAADLVGATVKAFEPVMRDKAWKAKVFDALNDPWVGRFSDEVGRTYPFHPQLMHLAEHEWANMAGFQKVRSTIRVFAATVYALHARARRNDWVPLLIGPGDLPLSDASVRENIIGSGLISDTKTQANYRSLAQNDIISLDESGGAARLLDLNRDDPLLGNANPRAAERAATMLFLASVVGSRGGGRRGASEVEVKASTVVPTLTYGLANADGLIKEVTDPDTGMASVDTLPGKGGQPPRYFMSTTQTFNMLVRAAKNSVSDSERDQCIARLAEDMTTTGPFKRKVFVAGDMKRTPRDVLATAGFDDARSNRLIVLDAAQFSLRNGLEKETVAAIESVMGIGSDPIPTQSASSAVFAVANIQRRNFARGLATNYLAHLSALGAPEIEGNPEMKAQATKARDEALAALKIAIRRAYQHIVYLSQPDPSLPRKAQDFTFDSDVQTALDGTTVWKTLVEQEKAFDPNEFSAEALVHNLRDDDYGRPLDEMCDAFWNSPRLPLLPNGEIDLRRAIYDAVQRGDLRLVDNAGGSVTVTAPTEINLNQSGLRLARPEAVEATPQPGPSGEGGPVEPGTSGSQAATVTPIGSDQAGPEMQVKFTVLTNLDDPTVAENIAQVFLLLYEGIDEGAASYISGTFDVIMGAKEAPFIIEKLKALGINATVQERR